MDGFIDMGIVSAISLAILGALAVRSGRTVSSEKIPMQWGIDGAPTWFAPRHLGIWFGFYLTLFLLAVLFAIASTEPEEKLPQLAVLAVVISALNIWIEIYHKRRVMRWEAERNSV